MYVFNNKIYIASFYKMIYFTLTAYHVSGKESRGITLQNARKGITHLCMQLQYVIAFLL